MKNITILNTNFDILLTDIYICSPTQTKGHIL